MLNSTKNTNKTENKIGQLSPPRQYTTEKSLAAGAPAEKGGRTPVGGRCRGCLPGPPAPRQPEPGRQKNKDDEYLHLPGLEGHPAGDPGVPT